MQEAVPSLVNWTLSSAAVWTWTTRAALQSREPGQPGPRGASHIAPLFSTCLWVVTAAGRGSPNRTHVSPQPTLPLLILLSLSFNQWMEDLVGMLGGGGRVARNRGRWQRHRAPPHLK